MASSKSVISRNLLCAIYYERLELAGGGVVGRVIGTHGSAQEIHNFTQFIADDSLGCLHITIKPQFIVHYLLCWDLLGLLGIPNSLQCTQFIAFIVDMVIYWDVQEITYFTQFIARNSVRLPHRSMMPQFIMHYLLCRDLLWLLAILHLL